MNAINTTQKAFGTASWALLFVCTCVFIVIHDAILGNESSCPSPNDAVDTLSPIVHKSVLQHFAIFPYLHSRFSSHPASYRLRVSPLTFAISSYSPFSFLLSCSSDFQRRTGARYREGPRNHSLSFALGRGPQRLLGPPLQPPLHLPHGARLAAAYWPPGPARPQGG